MSGPFESGRSLWNSRPLVLLVTTVLIAVLLLSPHASADPGCDGPGNVDAVNDPDPGFPYVDLNDDHRYTGGTDTPIACADVRDGNHQVYGPGHLVIPQSVGDLRFGQTPVRFQAEDDLVLRVDVSSAVQVTLESGGGIFADGQVIRSRTSDVRFSAGGEAQLDGAVLDADDALDVQVGDSLSGTAGFVASGRNVTWIVGGDAVIMGAQISAHDPLVLDVGGRIRAAGGSLSGNNDLQLRAGHDIELQDASVSSSGDLTAHLADILSELYVDGVHITSNTSNTLVLQPTCAAYLGTPAQGTVVRSGTNCDRDGDGLSESQEAAMGTRDDMRDTDLDGLDDPDEHTIHGTDPADADTDDDGLTDGPELHAHGTDPLDADSDDGGRIDGDEVARGTDPLLTLDDHWPTLWTERTAGGERAFAAETVSVVMDGRHIQDQERTVRLRNLTIDLVSEQWINVNGTSMQVFESDLLYVENFTGKLHERPAQDPDDRVVVLDGVAERAYLSNDLKGTLVHTFGRVRSDPDGRSMHVSIVHEVDGRIVQEKSTVYPLAAPPETPVFVTWDIWKQRDDVDDIGSYSLALDPGTHDGQRVTWLTLHNPDPVLMRMPIPFTGTIVCIQFPETPFWCA